MNLSEQCAVLLEAVEYDLLKQEDVIRWVDTVVEAMDKPPVWLIEFYTVNACHARSYEHLLREHSSGKLSTHRRIQVILLAFPLKGPLLHETLAKLFPIVICFDEERPIPPLEALDERLVEALVWWDSQDNLDVVEEPLQGKLANIFREYLGDANEIASVLSWKFNSQSH